MQQLATEIGDPREMDDDPAVWLFAKARLLLVGAGQRADVLLADGPEGDETGEIQDSRVAVHRAFARLTGKQQEALRLKCQFGFNPEEVARITGLSAGGASGLLQHAMSRVVEAMPKDEGKYADRLGDARLIAYALDEMEAAEKRAFVASMPDGKALLESAELIRRAIRELTQILQNGAPPPRRRRRGGFPVLRWAMVLAGVAVAVAAGWWFLSGRDGREAESFSASSAKDAEAKVEREAEPDDEQAAATVSGRTRKRELRPGEADWERKAFGRGSGQSAGLTGEGGGAAASNETAAAEAGADTISAEPTLPDEDEPEKESRRVREDSAVVLLPAGVGGAGAVGGTSADKPPENAAGAWTGSNSAETRQVGKGEKPVGRERVTAVAPRPPEPGLKDLQRALGQGQWPSPEAVSPAALLKQVPPEWPARGAQTRPLAVRMEMAPSPFAPGRQVVRVVVQARPAPPPVRPPANLVLAIDVSDSMNAPNRLPLVQAGLQRLAERLRPDDRVAVVTYAAEARQVRGSEPIGDEGRGLRDALAGLSAQGRTNGYEGLTQAYDVARQARTDKGLNAVILCTDGNFNLGETDNQTLARMAARFAADGIRLSVFGFGRSDRNDLRLELLAQEGGGQSCYVNTEEEAERLLAGQIEGLLEPVARDVVWRVDLDPAQVEDVRALGGSEATVPELLPGRNLSSFYEFTLRDSAKAPAQGWGEVQVDYFAARGAQPARLSQPVVATNDEWSRTTPGFRFAVAMAELGRILQAEPAGALAALERLEAWVRENLSDDAGGYRRDLLDTIALARQAAAK